MKCFVCKKETEELDKHHLIPKSQGGSNNKSNLILVCKDCHYKLHHPEWEDGNIEELEEDYKKAIKENVFSEGWGIIPNKVLRDLTIRPNDKVLYAELSALSGERGYCWATNKYLAGRLKLSVASISASITRLEKYLIIQDRTSYKRKIYVHNLQKGDFEPSKKVEGRFNESRSNLQQNLKHNNNNNNNNNNLIPLNNNGKEINNLIYSFHEVNPSYARLFANRSQRASLERLVKLNGLEKIAWLISILPKTNKMAYAPVITTPTALEDKLGNLIVFINKEKIKAEESKNTIAKI